MKPGSSPKSSDGAGKSPTRALLPLRATGDPCAGPLRDLLHVEAQRESDINLVTTLITIVGRLEATWSMLQLTVAFFHVQRVVS
jgi:hypothetical protein